MGSIMGQGAARNIMGSNISRKADQQHQNIKLILKLVRNKRGILVPLARVTEGHPKPKQTGKFSNAFLKKMGPLLF